MKIPFKEYDPKTGLISIHIPKCGGTSLTTKLSEWYGDKFFTHYFDEVNGLMPERYALLPGVCIHGHFNSSRGFGVKDYYPGSCQFITILRDPLEIMLSNYFYLKRSRGENYRDGQVFDYEKDFLNVNEFILKNKLPFLQFMPFAATASNYKQFLEKYFIFIGVAEFLEISVEFLAKKLGFSNYLIGRENQSLRDEEVDFSVKQSFIDNHPLEYEIYSYVKNNF